MQITEKAKQLVAEEYLSSVSGMHAVHQMEKILQVSHQYVPVTFQLINLLPEHVDFDVRINTVTYGLRIIYDLTQEQCNAIKQLVRMECEGANEPSRWPEEDLPF